MNQIKIGRFIAEQRRKCGLTQAELARRLGITDRAVSKWENGKSLPDSSLMLDLCDILKISIYDLLNGEVVTMTDYNEKNERIILELVKQKERGDRQLLTLEIVIGALSSIILFAAVLGGSYLQMETWLRILIIALGFVIFIVGIAFAIRIEQVAGYYECAKCHHRYVPTYKSTLFAMHVNRTRYMVCPKCGKRSWQEKVISANDDSE